MEEPKQESHLFDWEKFNNTNWIPRTEKIKVKYDEAGDFNGITVLKSDSKDYTYILRNLPLNDIIQNTAEVKEYAANIERLKGTIDKIPAASAALLKTELEELKKVPVGSIEMCLAVFSGIVDPKPPAYQHIVKLGTYQPVLLAALYNRIMLLTGQGALPGE